ncbi:MAG: SulP family inorganic anion transporter [Byssovorax sp.]
MSTDATIAHAPPHTPEEEVDELRAEPPIDDTLPPPPPESEAVPSMRGAHVRPDLGLLANLRHDLPAGLVVFLVAVPLCLGIALASGAPALSGIIAGVVGGLVIPLISRSELSVSGPAAGLAAVVAMGIGKVGGFEAFALAVVLAGLFQIALGALRAGAIAHLFPSSVIQGMLTAIGLLLILKQVPHAIGYDRDNFASVAFRGDEGENTFSLVYHAFASIHPGALLLTATCIPLLILWEKNQTLKRISLLPGPLVAVLVGLVAEVAFRSSASLAFGGKHLVQIPVSGENGSIVSALRFPSWSSITHGEVWILAVTLAVVASLETLLNVEAVDKLDPYHRKSPPNRELVAQGVANTLSGLIGGLPVTSVVVRSTAAVSAGARTRVAAFTHGALLLVATLVAASVLNRVPLACLAAILLMTGYKLAKPSIFKAAYHAGPSFFVPFAGTVVAILLTDLLKGTAIGLGLGLAFALYRVIESTFHIEKDGRTLRIYIHGHAHFFSRGRLLRALEHAAEGTRVIVEAAPGAFIDRDVLQTIEGFMKTARSRTIEVEVRGIALGAEKSAAG